MAKPDKDAELRLIREAAPKLEERAGLLYLSHKGLSSFVRTDVIVGATNVLPVTNGQQGFGLMPTQWTTVLTDRGAQLMFPGVTPADFLEHLPLPVPPPIRPAA